MADFEPHYFEFSRNFAGTHRLCGHCAKTYDDGAHIEITTLKSYTSYVCPSGEGLGHSAMYTGAYEPSLRTLSDHLCTCGREFVEEDRERWVISWEMQDDDGQWHPVERIGSRHSTESQRDGLLTLPEIRNVCLGRLVEAGDA